MRTAIVIGIPFFLLICMQGGSCNINDPGVPSSSTVASGIWGGNHLVMQVSSDEITLEFDCAHGRIASPLKLRNGRFEAVGTYVREAMGPTRKGGSSAVDAKYSGTVQDGKMDITIEFIRPQEKVGRFNLVHDKSGRLWKCY